MSPIILRCPQHLKNVHGHWEPNIEWLDAKLGIPSASGFHRILTPTGKLSKSSRRERYMGELLAEWALGEQWDTGIGNSHWVLRGIELEPQARLWYEMAYAEVEEVGFIWRDESRMAGCSPDGLVGDDGLLELKCPSPAQHVLYLSCPGQLARKYYWQVQGPAVGERARLVRHHELLPWAAGSSRASEAGGHRSPREEHPRFRGRDASAPRATDAHRAWALMRRTNDRMKSSPSPTSTKFQTCMLDSDKRRRGTICGLLGVTVNRSPLRAVADLILDEIVMRVRVDDAIAKAKGETFHDRSGGDRHPPPV